MATTNSGKRVAGGDEWRRRYEASPRARGRSSSRSEEDRIVNQRTQAEAEFLARELAASRLSLGKIEATLARVEERMERYEEDREDEDEQPPAGKGGTEIQARRAPRSFSETV